jgi:hypothetical protein
MEPIVVRYQFTEREALRASLEVSRVVAPAIRWIPWLGVVILLASVGAVINAKGKLSDAAFPVLLSAFFILAPVLIRVSARRQFKKMPFANKELTWEIDANRLRNFGDGAEASFEWKILFEVREVRDGFLLFPQRQFAHWLPKSAFNPKEDVEALRTLIRSSGVRHKGLPG